MVNQARCKFLSINRRIKLDFRQRNSIELLEILLALPTLLHNIVDAFRIAKGVGACPKVTELSIVLTDSRKPSWELKSSSGKVAFALSKRRSSIPSVDDIVRVLLEQAVGDVDKEIEEAMKIAEFVLVEKEKDKYAFMNLAICEEGDYVVYFKLFDEETEGETEVDDENLLPHLSACLVSINSCSMPVSAKIEQEGEKFSLRFRVSKLNGLNKLLVRCGRKILYTAVLFCTKPADLPNTLSTKLHNCKLFYGKDFLKFGVYEAYWNRGREDPAVYFEVEDGDKPKYGEKLRKKVCKQRKRIAITSFNVMPLKDAPAES